MKKKAGLLMGVGLIGFLIYNITFFLLTEASGNATFWLSYAFMILAFLVLGISAVEMGKRSTGLRDWMFGFPLAKHCVLYITLELAASVLFMLLSTKIKWTVAGAVQLVMLGIHLIFVLSCLHARDTIQEVQTSVKEKTAFMRLLKADVDMVAKQCGDTEARAAFVKLSEDVRFSDPMSSEALLELEGELSALVNEAKGCAASEPQRALSLCERASRVLQERNAKCKALK